MTTGSGKKRAGCLAAVITAVLCIGLLCFACRFRHFTNPADFTAAGYQLPFPVPENAADIRLAGRKILFGQQHLCAFTLPESDAYLFIRQYRPDSEETFKTPAECAAEDGPGSPLNSGASLRQVTDRNIADAKVVYYEPYHSGSRSRGILVFPDTREFVMFYFLSR